MVFLSPRMMAKVPRGTGVRPVEEGSTPFRAGRGATNEGGFEQDDRAAGDEQWMMEEGFDNEVVHGEGMDSRMTGESSEMEADEVSSNDSFSSDDSLMSRLLRVRREAERIARENVELRRRIDAFASYLERAIRLVEEMWGPFL